MKSLTLLLSMLCLASAIYAETFTLSPTDDMYTDPDHPGDNPAITELWTANFPNSGHFERIMLMFELEPYSGLELESAILHLTRFYSCATGGTTSTTFYAIDQPWNEDTWDHTEHITYDEDVNMPFVFSGTGGNTIVAFDVDMTAFMQSWIESGAANNGFLIMANNNQKFSKFYSKEHSNEGYRPTLTLTYANDVNDGGVTPPELSACNYPNPFNPVTTIDYSLAEPGNVEIDVFNVRGQLVRNLFDGHRPQGRHQIVWDGRDVHGRPAANGVYYYRITAGASSITRRMVMLK
ncbi:MAG: DNRLRE domain-containing protein [Candidatus Cloacimonetes bacterium]|nr:DNRLRE domain-containing protein [Candidatus Cloacimonadota bacterium]